jgi:hypothetical protein
MPGGVPSGSPSPRLPLAQNWERGPGGEGLPYGAVAFSGGEEDAAPPALLAVTK